MTHLPQCKIVTEAWWSWVLWGVFRGFLEDAKTLGFPSTSIAGINFSVASDLSIVAVTRISSGSAMTALGQKQPLSMLQILAPERLLSGYTGHSPLNLSGCFWEKRTVPKWSI